MAFSNEQFIEASAQWDLDTLYTDLASVKGKQLTPMEKIHLRGLLSGYSPSEIAEKLEKNSRGVETDLCATVYRYVKGLVDKTTEKVDNWRSIIDWLEEAGYRSFTSVKSSVGDLLPQNSVVNISNISIENNQIVIVIKLEIPTSNFPKNSNDDLAK